MNKHLLLILIIAISLILSSCWNYNELDSYYIVAGIAVDKNTETNLYDVTVEVVNMKNTDIEPNIESQIIQSSGNSIFGAVREIIKVSSKKLYWSHATTLILGEDLAKDSIIPVLDWIARDQEPRLAMDIIISKETSAREILETESLTTNIRSFELDIMTNKNNEFINSPTTEIYEVINVLAQPKTHLLLPTVETVANNDNLTNRLSGGAVFKKDKLVGYLSIDDVFYCLIFKNKVKKGLINVITEEDNIVLEIHNSNTKIKPIYSDGEVKFNIVVNTYVSIAELDTDKDFISKPGRDELKKISEEYLRADMERTFKKLQKDFGLDIFGFGNIVRQRNPNVWKDIESNWEDIFLDLDLNIECNIHIKNSGHFSQPIEVNN